MPYNFLAYQGKFTCFSEDHTTLGLGEVVLTLANAVF